MLYAELPQHSTSAEARGIGLTSALSQSFVIVLCGWLGGFGKKEEGQLLTIEQVGEILKGMRDILSTQMTLC